MQRSLTPEIMDDPRVPHDVRERFHRQLGSIQGFLGNRRAILDALRRHPRPIGRVLDIGCGNGELLVEIRRALNVEVVGVELRAPKHSVLGVPIVEADATREPLPEADVAVCVTVFHHLAEEQIVALIRNAGRSVGRLIVLDLVRHWLPFALYTAFMRPFLGHPLGPDGRQSIRRAYTPRELLALAHHALAGSRARMEQSVTPFRSRLMIDIMWN
jgi:SAM-dependent methyltransferase